MSRCRSDYLKRLRPRKPHVASQSDSGSPCHESRGSSQSSTLSAPNTSLDSEYENPLTSEQKDSRELGKEKAVLKSTGRVNVEQRRQCLAMETLDYFDTFDDAQWYYYTDNAWSGHSQTPGDLIFPRRFEDPEWNILNEWYWLGETVPASTLGMGEWKSLICHEASSKRVAQVMQEFKGELKPFAPGTVVEAEHPVCLLCGGNVHVDWVCVECTRCESFGHLRRDCDGVEWLGEMPTGGEN